MNLSTLNQIKTKLLGNISPSESSYCLILLWQATLLYRAGFFLWENILRKHPGTDSNPLHNKVLVLDPTHLTELSPCTGPNPLHRAKSLYWAHPTSRSYVLVLDPTHFIELRPRKGTLFEKFSTFYGTRSFITVFTLTRQWSLPWSSWLQPILSLSYSRSI